VQKRLGATINSAIGEGITYVQELLTYKISKA